MAHNGDESLAEGGVRVRVHYVDSMDVNGRVQSRIRMGV
jgi:hypothetical protein